MDWLLRLLAFAEGVTPTQLAQIEKALPATKKLIEAAVKAAPTIKALTPLIDEATSEWSTIGPGVQVLIDVISRQK